MCVCSFIHRPNERTEYSADGIAQNYNGKMTKCCMCMRENGRERERERESTTRESLTIVCTSTKKILYLNHRRNGRETYRRILFSCP